MGDTKSKEFRKAQGERRELTQLAIEELVARNGQIPSSADVGRELGLPGDSHTIRRDWDYLHEKGLVPERPNKRLVRRVPGRNFGENGGASLLQAEALLRAVLGEISNATPEYLDMSRDFFITRLEECSRIIEDAIARAVGTTVDDFIGQIRKEER